MKIFYQHALFAFNFSSLDDRFNAKKFSWLWFLSFCKLLPVKISWNFFLFKILQFVKGRRFSGVYSFHSMELIVLKKARGELAARDPPGK